MVTSWTLVMFIYAGIMAKGDSVALHSVPGFTTEAACMAQGKVGNSFVSGTTKAYEFKCLKVS